jgi:UDP-N-acetylmuramyl-tripeptide synthetase
MRRIASFLPQWSKNIYHLGQAIVANGVYHFPAKKLRVIGVTGTDGKTTTTKLIAAILEEAGYVVAMASTIELKIREQTQVNTSKHTTLGAFALQKFLWEAKRAKCDFVVLETASHALDQHRVWGIPYEVAVITNITREHLDYHKTMEQYRKAKKKLFDGAKYAVVNADMENPEDFLEGKYERTLTYGLLNASAQVLASKVKLRLDGASFEVDGQPFSLVLPGTFNIENALAAIAVGLLEGISLEVMARALEKVTSVAGRMEKVSNTNGLEILIDYAVTPNALGKLYGLVSQMKPRKDSKIIAVFGACGERDRGKRPIMGGIVSSYADIIILTNEDPYFENPHRILREIDKGVMGKKRGKNYFHIMNRRKAIAKALKIAEAGDIVVVTGKGAETTIAIGKERLPWNDKQVILELLAAK